jgi:type II secretory pathway component GspD/PulD (secretin)
MKTKTLCLLTALLLPASTWLNAQDADEQAEPVEEVVLEETVEREDVPPAEEDFIPPAPERIRPSPAPTTEAGGELRLNFRNAPLDLVLDYLSEAAGFTIVLETQVRGTLDVWSNRPVSTQEAIDILDSALAKNGYAAIRNGRRLTIISKDSAKTRNVPIVQSTDWETIPQSEEIATYIIPVRYINAAQLQTSLQPLIPTSMQIIANADSNSLLITDAQAAIRRIAHIASLLDSSVSSVSTMRIIPLKHADAKEMAATISSLYSTQNRNATGGGRGGAGGGSPLRNLLNPGGGGN